jgi:hypothetical protein
MAKLKFEISLWNMESEKGEVLTKHLGGIDIQLIGNHAAKRAEKTGQDQFVSVEEGVGPN